LIMSATPIPRTLAMTLYADLDISNIHELPKGRKPIETAVISEAKRDEVIKRLREVCKRGEQAYWICPLIEESDKLELEAAEATFARLCKELPGISIALLHGRMKGNDKTEIMQAFKAQKTQILVATTVVEVGVDVPNASIMIIENPERMGLSQLHQLRGRVGRGEKQSFCVLLYHPPLGETAMARLSSLKHSQNGFELAEKDLELRGPGEFLGTRQTGGIEFRFASLIRNQNLLKDVHHAAEIMRQKYPEPARELVEKWFGQSAEFVKV
jgi:ATP-dependent DNA helicase RecG